MYGMLFLKPSPSSASLSVLKWINTLEVIFSISLSLHTICRCQTPTAVALLVLAEERPLTVLDCKAKQQIFLQIQPSS